MKRHVLFGYLTLYFVFIMFLTSLLFSMFYNHIYVPTSISSEQSSYYSSIAYDAYFKGLSHIEDKNIQINLSAPNSMTLYSKDTNVSISYTFENNRAVIQSITHGKGGKISILNFAGAFIGFLLALAFMCKNYKYYFQTSNHGI